MKDKLPEPDNIYGYYQDTIEKIFNERNLDVKDFFKWMSGQTYAYINNRPTYYTADLQRFLTMGGSEAPIYD